MNKTVIGGVSDVAERANREQVRAQRAEAEHTMIQRRIRTFYDAISEVHFPAEGAPSWANDWKEWLLTGTVFVPITETEIEILDGTADNPPFPELTPEQINALDTSADNPGGIVEDPIDPTDGGPVA